ncbi:MAG: S8 family serine peptidase [Asgard group archaeon]|nr:S8 family serine peptidase [Asgard group archaeon]
MKERRILSICLLSLFVFAAASPIVFANASFTSTVAPNTVIYKKTTFDLNGDKIDDKLLRDIKRSNSLFMDAILLYDHEISSRDRNRLDRLGVVHSEETWDLGRRVVISANKDRLDLITNLPGVSLVTTTELRYIMIAIKGEDFSDLSALEKYEGTEIFWSVGCALVPYYSGVENDIVKLGDYTVISDTTDIKLYPDVITEETITLNPDTLVSAEKINATAMWSLGYTGTEIKVGVIDTGINAGHIAFEGRVVDAASFIHTSYGYDYNDPTTTDPHGHGSHTSGIAGAGDTAGSYVGIAKNCSLYHAKIGSPAPLPSIIAGLDWLVNTSIVDVVNFSFGGGDSVGLDPLEIAFANAVNVNGVVCVTSAGNSGDQGYYTVGSPATDDIIHVGGTVITGGTPTMISYSARGPTADDHMKPDILAPGYNIYSCDNIGNGYVYMSGTSMSSPHVAGAAALLIEACIANGYTVNPGLIKAAMMKTATPIPSINILIQARGQINVGAAWHYIEQASIDTGIKIVGACNPVQQPLMWWTTLLQGQVTEQYLTCISAHKTDLTIEMSGNVTSFLTIGSIGNQWTNVVKITYDVPFSATVGQYTGDLTFKYKTYVLDTVDIGLTVTESNGHNMLLNFKTTDYSIDHMYGQYAYFTSDILMNDYVLSEQYADLDSGIINNYDCVWLPDPFDLNYPDSYKDDYNKVETHNAWTESEKTALTNYVASGGSVFLCFLGYSESEIDGWGTVLHGTNITAINDWTDQYGIHVRDTVWTGSYPNVVNTAEPHALSVDVDGIDHWGTSLEVSGNAVQITELSSGSSYATCATYQHANGGRVIVLTTNFCLDTAGYINDYNDGTENDQFGRNLVRWATAHSRMSRNSITVNDQYATLQYDFISGTETFGGYVIDPNDVQEDLVWTEVSSDTWEATYEMTVDGIYEFYPECGVAGLDDFDYLEYQFGEIPTSPTGVSTIIVILITGFGLAAWILIQKFKRK